MPKDTKTLCIKKGCASVLTQPLLFSFSFSLSVYYSPAEADFMSELRLPDMI